MKKLIGLVGGVLVVIMGLGFAGLAHAATATVTIGSQSASNGAAISVPINASNFGGAVDGIDFTVHFNPALLTYTGFDGSTPLNNVGTLTTSAATTTAQSGSFIVDWFSSSAHPLSLDSGNLITLNFTVATSAITTANLTFTGTDDLYDTIANLIPNSYIGGAITLNPPTPNATLSGMTVSQGTLTPTFSSSTTSYTASVANNITSMTLTPTATQGASSTITVNGTTTASGAASGAILLNVGSNVITVHVTAYDSVTTDTYTITVTRAASSDASLSGMTVSQGTLAPAFASSTNTYTESVAYGVTSMTVTPTAGQGASSTITVNGTTTASGASTNIKFCQVCQLGKN